MDSETATERSRMLLTFSVLSMPLHSFTGLFNVLLSFPLTAETAEGVLYHHAHPPKSHWKTMSVPRSCEKNIIDWNAAVLTAIIAQVLLTATPDIPIPVPASQRSTRQLYALICRDVLPVKTAREFQSNTIYYQ